MYTENETLKFMEKLFEKIGFDSNSLTLYQERDIEDMIEDMIDDFVHETVDPMIKEVNEMKDPIDNEIIGLEILEGKKGFKGQKKLDILYVKQETLKEFLEILDY